MAINFSKQIVKRDTSGLNSSLGDAYTADHAQGQSQRLK